MQYSFLAALALAAGASASDIIPNEWIVQFDNTASIAETRLAYRSMVGMDNILHEYNFGGFTGFAFKGDQDMLSQVSRMPGVMNVDPNGWAHALDQTAAECTDRATDSRLWGLQRLNGDATSRIYREDVDYKTAGQVQLYVLDTGVQIDHPEFAGNTRWGANFMNDNDDRDVNGHGTHCAGTMMSTSYGVNTPSDTFEIVAVKVLGNSGSGSWAGIIAGMEWTASDCAGRQCVANMSLGGAGVNTSVNNALNAAFRAGVVMVAAAGNNNSDACNFTPAAASEAYTVGATDSSDRRSSFSNYGSCTDIFAPGSSILSTYPGSSTAVLSGTSMAAPHVAGVVGARMALSERPLSPKEVQDAVLGNAYRNSVSNPGAGSPNLLLSQNCA